MDRASLWPTGAKDRSGLGELRTINFYTVALRGCERVLDDGRCRRDEALHPNQGQQGDLLERVAKCLVPMQ